MPAKARKRFSWGLMEPPSEDFTGHISELLCYLVRPLRGVSKGKFGRAAEIERDARPRQHP